MKSRTIITYLFILDICGYIYPHVVILQPDDPKIDEYSSVKFTCSANDTVSRPAIKWTTNAFRDQNLIGGLNQHGCTISPNNTELYHFQCITNSSFALTVLNITRTQHRSHIVCQLPSNSDNKYFSNEVYLFVKVPVSDVILMVNHENVSGNVQIRENTRTEITCRSSPVRPNANITIFFLTEQNKILELDDLGVSSRFENDSFELQRTVSTYSLNVNRSINNWQIYCNAKNLDNKGTDSNKIILDIQYPPSQPQIENITSDRVFRVIENTAATLLCSVIGGNPRPELNWTCFPKTETAVTIYNTDEVISHVTVNASRADNELNCSCTSTHMLSNSSTSLTIDVLYPPSSPTFSINSKNITEGTVRVIQNSTLTLSCSATSKPAADFQWTYMNKTVNGSKLGLTNVQRVHNGTIICTASNTMYPTFGDTKFDNTSSSAIDLDVLYPPDTPVLKFTSHVVLTENITNKVVAIKGDSFEVHCIATSNPEPIVMWNGPTTVNTKPSILKIEKVSDDMNRTCNATNVMNETQGNVVVGHRDITLTISVLFPPRYPDIIANGTMLEAETGIIKVIENTSLILKCETSSKPGPDYLWIPNGIVNSSEIVLSSLNRNDVKSYQCNVSNTMKRDPGIGETKTLSRVVILDILYPPEIVAWNSTITVREGVNVNVTCSVNPGNPTNSSVNWVNNEIWRPSNLLLLPNVTRDEDSFYTCQASNFMTPTNGISVPGNTSKTMYLEVLYEAEIKEFVIKDHEGKEIIIVNETDTVVFICSAVGKPKAYVELKKGLDNIHNPVLENLQYTYRIGSCRDTGNYTCFGNNTLFTEHTHQSRSIRLFVNCSPRQSVEVKQNVTVSQNGSVVFRFIAMAYPLPVFKWYKHVNGELTVPSNGHITNASISENEIEINFTLHNATLDDYGEYILTVNNTFGGYQQSFFLINKEATHAEQNTAKSIAGPVAGGVIGGILGIVAVVATVFIARKRGIVFRKTKDAEDHRVYQNVGFKEELKQSKRLPALPPEEDSEDVHGDHRTIAQQQQQQQDFDTDEHPYLNTMELIDLMKKVNVTDLFSYVTNKSYQEFSDEFGMFPSGLIASIPCSFASKPQNAVLNRYQGIYPYDHSRVIILGQPDFFINASYIDGNTGAKEYIASLGPTVKHTLGFRTFWNMVWHESSDVIVMLTNLQEPSGMKCEKYWADRGTTRNIGDFTIQSIDEEVAAEYKVRTFKVFKDDETRTVTQLHYTAWPDKKVPEDVTSLIEFRQRVKAAPTRSSGPLIVHCSAGVGRTGTYIALDRLIKEGKSKNAINVYDCVMNMRKQRVNMVQTLDQYVYLHQALVYCLVFDIEPVSSNGIDEYVKKTSNNVYSKLFQQLQQTVEDETLEEKEARAKNGDMLERNRTTADIPSDAHRIRLFLDKQMGESDYINAVYLNGFKRQEHFIIAQSPLPTTLDDFVCLLYQATCCCIVSLDDYQQTGASNVTYLPPDNQPMKYGTFTISCSNLDVKSGYSVRKLKLGFTGKFGNGERIVYHFEFTGWKHDDRTPKDPKLFVDFIKEVDKYATELEDEHSHVLVHCMSGSERSGLFCAVYNLMDKMEQERQVSVVNMLRRVRARRRTAIPNMEQLKFCYQALNAFVKSYKI